METELGAFTHEVQVCVTHWRILRAWRKEPYAAFGFTACPIEEGAEHEVLNFAAFEELPAVIWLG
jgi:hypothetical protein